MSLIILRNLQACPLAPKDMRNLGVDVENPGATQKNLALQPLSRSGR